MHKTRHACHWLLLALMLTILTWPVSIARADATGAQPLMKTIQMTHTFDTYHVYQTDKWGIEAGAQGTLTVKMDLDPGTTFRIWVDQWDPSGHYLRILNQVLTSDQPTAQVELPAPGSYNLFAVPVSARTSVPGRLITVTGPEITTVGTAVAPIQLRQIGRYETLNSPFDLQAGILPPVKAKELRIYLDGKMLKQNILNPDGSAQPVIIDPTTLSDGIHNVAANSMALDGDSQGYTYRYFFVDRVDTFQDVPQSYWARKPIKFLYALKVVSGRSANLFAPDQPVTRAEFAKMMALAMHLPIDNQAKTPFADVADDWSKPYIAALAQAGLISGVSANGQSYFQPGRTISRAEAATILGRALRIADKDISTLNLSPSVYKMTDINDLPSYARASVLILRNAGWINGFQDGSFRPGSNLKRDQAAQILSKLFGL